MMPEIPPDPGIPRRQYEEAVSLMREGHYEEALPILTRLWAISPLPPFGLTRGRCLVALGRYVEAAETLESVEHRANEQGSRWASIHDVAAHEKEEARAKIVTLVLGSGGFDGVTATLDGNPIALGVVRHDPGRAVVVLSRGGWSTREDVVLAPGETRPFVFAYPGPDTRPRKVPWYTWVTGAGAVAGLATFGAIELVAAHDDRHALHTPAIFALSTGVVLAVATTVIVVTAKER